MYKRPFPLINSNGAAVSKLKFETLSNGAELMSTLLQEIYYFSILGKKFGISHEKLSFISMRNCLK
jgi:hypothetical protein